MADIKKRKRRRPRVARGGTAQTPALASELERAVGEAMSAAVSHHQAGEFSKAAQLYAQVLSTVPQHSEAWHLSGVLAHQQGDHRMAVDLIGHAIELDDANANYHLNLGTALAALGETHAAVKAFNRSLEIEPTCTAWNNLGNAHQSLGKTDAAIEAYDAAIMLDPDDARPVANLGAALLERGSLRDAESALAQSLEMDPNLIEAENNLALARTRLGEFPQAIEGFVSVLSKHPDASAAWKNLRNCLNDVGSVDEATRAYSKVIPESDEMLCDILSVSICSVVNESAQSIDRFRQQLAEVTRRYAGCSLLDRQRELVKYQLMAPFYLPYQGLDDRALKEAYARMFEPNNTVPLHAAHPRSSSGKRRIGFPIAYDRHHVFLRFMGGLLDSLAASGEFEVVVACTPQSLAPMRSAQHEDTEFVVMEGDLLHSAQAIARAQCDVLYHFEVGTDTLNYFLPFFSAAPTQVTSWGTPVTSGIPQMDYFLSSDLIEPIDAKSQYSERLYRMNSLPVQYARPMFATQVKSREDFGFGSNERLYGCMQSPFKNHPDFDDIIGGILRNDENAKVVFVGSAHETSNEFLRRRMERSLADVHSRVRFFPRLDRNEFIDLARCCDVLLDTIHFGGGATTYESLSLGTPVVTLPGEFMRGRITAGCYRLLELDECVARDRDDYVRRAVDLANDKDLNMSVRKQIAERVDVLFDCPQAGTEFREFLHSIIDAASEETPR